MCWRVAGEFGFGLLFLFVQFGGLVEQLVGFVGSVLTAVGFGMGVPGQFP
ncbi:MAG: hypothetical protein WAW36_00195 [Methylovulum miyakonense]